jgi:proline iminopeptidase
MYAHDLMRVDRIPAAIRQFEVADSIERASYAADGIAPALDWHRPHNLELLALLYLHQGRLRDAERLLGEVRALPPAGAYGFAYLRTLPELRIVRGRAAEAEPLLAALTGDSVPGARVLGRALGARARLALGRVDEARADLAVAEEAFARAAPFEAALLRPHVDLARGAVALRDGRRADADSLLRGATAAASALPGPDGWVSALLAHDGALDLARRAEEWALVERLARALIAHAPSYAPGHHALALAAERRGEHAAARASLTRALRLWKGADADLPERVDAVGRTRAASAPPREGYLTGAGGARLFYRVEGTGTDTIVVLHGGPGSSHQYVRAYLGPLAARHVIVYYDQRGGGRSTLYADSAKLGFTHFVADLEAVRRHFRLGRMTLLGHSWGGILGPLYALAYPARVERMVLVAPQGPAKAPYLDDGNREVGRRIAERLDPGTRARVDSLQRAMATTDDPAAVCRAVGPLMARAFTPTPELMASVDPADFCDGTPEAIRGAALTGETADRSLGDYDLRPRAQPLRRIPTLIVGGADDPYRTSAEGWAATLPTARLVMLPGAGHNPQVERPAEFHRAVAEFLDRGARATRTSLP